MDRMVIIFNICFMLLAVIGIACVHGCDVDSCSVGNIQHFDLENNGDVDNCSVVVDSFESQDSDAAVCEIGSYDNNSSNNLTYNENVAESQLDVNSSSQISNVTIKNFEPEVAEGIMQLYGSHTPIEMANVSHQPLSKVIKYLQWMIDGKCGEKYQTFILNKNVELKNQMNHIHSCIVDNFDGCSGVKPTLDADLLYALPDEYGSKNLSALASDYGVDEDIMLEIIREVKTGQHGEILKRIFFKKDNENKLKIIHLDKCIYEEFDLKRLFGQNS